MVRNILFLLVSLVWVSCGKEPDPIQFEPGIANQSHEKPQQENEAFKLYQAGDFFAFDNPLKCNNPSTCIVEARTQFDYKSNFYEINILRDNGQYYYQEFKNKTMMRKDALDKSKIRSVCSKAGGGGCKIDTLSFQPNYGWLSITGMNHYWNFPIDDILKSSTGSVTTLNTNTLNSVNRYANGPCHSSVIKGQACKFDSRTLLTYKKDNIIEVVESITAYGLYWNYAKKVPFNHVVTESGQVIGNVLGTVARYKAGPCFQQEINNCKLDSRTVHTAPNGDRTETITVGQQFWTYVNGKNGYEQFSFKGNWRNAIDCNRSKTIAPPIKLNILLVEYNPTLPNGQRALDYANIPPLKEHIWRQTEFFKETSCGRLEFNFVDYIVHEKIPVKHTGYQYTLEGWMQAVDNRDFFQGAEDKAEYSNIIKDNKICDYANNHDIDEVWVHAGPGFGFYESAMVYGPNSPEPFWINGPSFLDTCNKLVTIGLIDGHNYAHRAESTMEFIYGRFNTTQAKSEFDRFGHNKFQAPGLNAYGCGRTHFSPNSPGSYIYWDKGTAVSYCDDYLNYPDLTGATKTISCETWGCSVKGYEAWWWNHIPMYTGTNKNGLLNDWWKYIFKPEHTSADKGKGVGVILAP